MPICPKCRGVSEELGAKCPRDEYYYIHEDALEDAERDAWIGTLAAEKYVIVGLISEGGMGAVYRAIQLPVQREIAFKVLRAELQDSKQGKERFAREARAISRLSHPNIITMHDFGVDTHGHPFMAMEYAPGHSLADWMATPGLTLERICHVFRQILSAMSEAHEQGVIHRDLKPENLIVTRAGNDADYVKLLDFGIARMVHDTASRGLTRDGEVFGTPHYMAPEQAQGKRDIGPPADVYALGIMFFELLSGDCPFDAPTPLSILYMQINDDLPTLRPKNKMEVSDGLRALIAHATAKDPAQRFENAGAMLNAMDSALSEMSGVFAAIGDSSGVFTRPDGVLEASTAAPVPAASPVAEKATEIDLSPLGEDSDDAAQIADAHPPSNQVPISDPAMATDLELGRYTGDGKRKLLLIGLLAFLLVGGGAVFVMSASGEDDALSLAESKSAIAPPDEAPLAPAEEALEAAPPVDEVERAGLQADEPAEELEKPVAAPAEPAVDAKTAASMPAIKSKPSDSRAKPGDRPTSTSKAQTSAAKKAEKFDPKAASGPAKFEPAKFELPANKENNAPKKFEAK